jgi:imidazolonepropionase-like amidohydrolase
VKATRAASVDDLLASALPRIDALLAEGVSLIEVKSGYGLDRNTELAMLRAARRIERVRPARSRTSFLGAHFPPITSSMRMKMMPDTGIVRGGLRADLAPWNVEHPAELAYRIGSNPLHKRIFAGDY